MLFFEFLGFCTITDVTDRLDALNIIITLIKNTQSFQNDAKIFLPNNYRSFFNTT